MKFIMLSGGSGKRLWPLSNDQRSKQFIKILKSTTGQLESMVQRVWRQLNEAQIQDDVYIATSASQVDILKSQLSLKQSHIVVEPERRDTFPAIALAASYLRSVEKIDVNETIAVMPVDPYVEISYFEKIKQLDILLKQKESTLSLIGIKPTFPSEKYGYILPSITSTGIILDEVNSFKEKPSQDLANQFIKKGAMWNSGVFGFKLGTLLEHIEALGFSTDYGTLLENYTDLPKISFDYEFVEKATDISYLRYEGSWKDLGTWNVLSEEMGSSKVGDHIAVIDSDQTNVINNLEIPIAVLGVDNAMIVASPDGLLVSSKKDSPKVKELSSNFLDQPRYVEQSWGNTTTIQEDKEVSVKTVKLVDGESIDILVDAPKQLIILSGYGKLVTEDDYVDLTTESIIKFSPNKIVKITSGSNLKFLVVTKKS